MSHEFTVLFNAFDVFSSRIKNGSLPPMPSSQEREAVERQVSFADRHAHGPHGRRDRRLLCPERLVPRLMLHRHDGQSVELENKGLDADAVLGGSAAAQQRVREL